MQTIIGILDTIESEILSIDSRLSAEQHISMTVQAISFYLTVPNTGHEFMVLDIAFGRDIVGNVLIAVCGLEEQHTKLIQISDPDMMQVIARAIRNHPCIKEKNLTSGNVISTRLGKFDWEADPT